MEYIQGLVLREQQLVAARWDSNAAIDAKLRHGTHYSVRKPFIGSLKRAERRKVAVEQRAIGGVVRRDVGPYRPAFCQGGHA